jgi:hypothetical protein
VFVPITARRSVYPAPYWYMQAYKLSALKRKMWANEAYLASTVYCMSLLIGLVGTHPQSFSPYLPRSFVTNCGAAGGRLRARVFVCDDEIEGDTDVALCFERVILPRHTETTKTEAWLIRRRRGFVPVNLLARSIHDVSNLQIHEDT